MKGDYRVSYYEIRVPIWLGGRRHIGLAPGRVVGVNELRVNISYRRKKGELKGELIYPDTYYISPQFFHNYNGDWDIRYGTKLKLFLIEDLLTYEPDISMTRRIMFDEFGIDEDPKRLQEIKNKLIKD
jgi:hypothetical protein